jgi:chromosome partitioning protein
MVIVVGGIKGGSGKTTLSTNLCVLKALSGQKILLVDTDQQRSSSEWTEHRESLNIETPWTTIQLEGEAVRTQIPKLKKDYDEVIVDVGAGNTNSQRAALMVATILIAPFQPRCLDVWTVDKLSNLIQEARMFNPELKVFAVINKAEARGKDNRRAIEVIKKMSGVECLENMVCQRKAFSNAIAAGLGVIELTPKDLKAVSEIQNLNDTITKLKLC